MKLLTFNTASKKFYLKIIIKKKITIFNCDPHAVPTKADLIWPGL